MSPSQRRCRVRLDQLVVALAAIVLAAAVPAAAVPAATALPAHGAEATPQVRYRPPVDAPIVVPFAAPADPYGPGHRGVTFGTAGGEAVRAPGPGRVVFAGAVAGQRWVSVAHEDGLRSTVGPLTTIAVRAGDDVDAGDLLGVAAGPLLLTFRRAGRYVDPQLLLAGGRRRVHLIADRAPPAGGGASPSRYTHRSVR